MDRKNGNIEFNRRAGLPDKLKENPFLIPDGYFEAFPGRMQRRIKESKTYPAASVRKESQYKWHLAAAVLVILAGLSIILVVKREEPVIDAGHEFSLNVGDLEADNFIDNLDEYTLVNFYLENSRFQDSAFTKDLLPEFPSDTGITPSDIEQFLLEGNGLENLILNL